MTGAGISAASLYRPRYRARVGGVVQVLSGDDEDELTMAHAALSRLTFADQGTTALFLAGRQEASPALSDALGASFTSIHRLADAATALSLAVDAVAGGAHEQAVVVSSTLGSPLHDGSTAFTIEADAPLAQLQGRGFAGSIATVPACLNAIGQALAEAGWREGGPGVICYPPSIHKSIASVAKSAGLAGRLRSSGMAAPLEALYETLAAAQPGEKILFLGDGGTVCALAFEVRGRMPEAQWGHRLSIEVRDVQDHLRRRSRPSFGAVISDTFRARETGAVLRLEACYCAWCDQYIYPPSPRCALCRKSDHLQACRLPRHGTIFTFTEDTLAGANGESIRIAVVDFGGQGRFLCQVTDDCPGTTELEMEVELVLRRLMSAPVNQPYYWKCRPAVQAPGEGGA
jgi:uncharacterized OB-fold protein